MSSSRISGWSTASWATRIKISATTSPTPQAGRANPAEPPDARARQREVHEARIEADCRHHDPDAVGTDGAQKVGRSRLAAERGPKILLPQASGGDDRA